MIRNFLTPFTFIGALCLQLSLSATIPTPILINYNAKLDSNERCDLQAPANFRVTGTGASVVALAWSPVENAIAYYVEAIDKNNQQVVDRQVVTTTSAIMHLPYAGRYDFTVAASAGDNCRPSNNLAWISNYIGPIIAELIDLGYSAGICDYGNGEQTPCLNFSNQNAQRWYEVLWNGNGIGRFQIIITGNMPGFASVKVGEDDDLPYVKTKYYENQTQQLECIPGSQYSSAIVSSIIFSLDCENTSQNDLFKMYFPLVSDPEFVEICFVYARPEVSIAPVITCWLNPEGGGEDGDLPGERNGDFTHESPQPKVTNPVYTDLHIVLPEFTKTLVNFQIFNLDGRLMFQETAPACQEYNLPTAGLPAGFYLLRIDANGVSSTYKVVKTQ